MKLLVIRLSSLGDIVLTTPVVRCLKQQLPDAEIHFLTDQDFKTVVAANPYINKVMLLEHSFDLLIHELKQENYDYVIDLQHNSKTSRIKRALKVNSASFNNLSFKKWIRTALRINLLPRVHIIDRYFKTVKKFGIRNDGQGLDYFIPAKDEVKPSDIPVSHSFGYIGLVIGAAYNTRKLPVHKLKELCSNINHPVILLGDKDDRNTGDEIAATDDIKIYNACGKFNINETADLIRKAKVIVTHDTGWMHVAAAFKKPVISVWGNTIPAFGITPYYGDYQNKESRFEIEKLWCRPCSSKGYKKCPLGHFKCMGQQDVERMARVAVNSIELIKA
jgi:ADP-heptose:LPS heptosyltransferase